MKYRVEDFNTRDKIMKFLPEYYFIHHYMPTAKEIAEEVDVTQNTVIAHMRRLLRQGFIETDLTIKNELGECSRTAWTTRGYRFGVLYPREFRLPWWGE